MKHLASAVSAILVAITVAPAASADDTTAPAPEVRYPPSSVRPKIIVGGVAVLGLAYAATFAASSSWPGGIWPKIPIVGPWYALGKTACALNSADCSPGLSQLELKSNVSCTPGDSSCVGKVVALDVGFGVAGLLQLAGIGLIAEGILMKTESSTPPKKPSLALGLPGGLTLHPVPTVSARFTGLGLVGTF